MTLGSLPSFVEELVQRLRRRGLMLGVDDCYALRQALAAGFGWESGDDFEDLCVALWAKSRQDATVIRASFAAAGLPDWRVALGGPAPTASRVEAAGADSGEQPGRVETPPRYAAVRTPRRLSAIAPPPRTGRDDPSLVLVPRYPVPAREVAQIWRRLRRPVRQGPALEIDSAATVRRRSRAGVVTPPVVVPRRRNIAHLVLLIDRGGSMTPYHGYLEHLRTAIHNDGRLGAVVTAYFHDLPGCGGDRKHLRRLADPLNPELDQILPLINPMRDGRVYADAALTAGYPFAALLDTLTPKTATAVISDAGAARHSLNTVRLLDTIAFAKAIYARTRALVWLNPAPADSWKHTTAGQLARHVPMFALDRDGMQRAVEVLRGRPQPIERPL
jgi:uncharacterized protein